MYRCDKKKVELLAPVGNYEAFLGALNAGADAFYLGGERFGARAYAENFTIQELCLIIRKAHFYNKKVYLTVNTLLKDNEITDLYDYIVPLYEEGLDGVIIQDYGVFSVLKEAFPQLELHASTQMTLTGVEGAAFLESIGASRIVPARELSLSEIREFKSKTNLELECFIHGAMCYCYSGQCLFSSILGGRSGNRGRCAQPCRLPYEIVESTENKGRQIYPLSMKDMCTLEVLPELIEAGIDSFKIEGRMKKAEYAAGVTAIYRKYIDLYYSQGAQKYKVDKKDIQIIRQLYIRSEIQTGYYKKHNGKNMITFTNPAYQGSDKQLIQSLREAYVREPSPINISVALMALENTPLQLTVSYKEHSVSMDGDIVEAACKAPITEEQIKKQLQKTGNTFVKIDSCKISMQDSVFISVKSLNQLRRDAILALENRIIMSNGFSPKRTDYKPEHCYISERVVNKRHESDSQTCSFAASYKNSTGIEILIRTTAQLKIALDYKCDTIYIESDLITDSPEEISKLLTLKANKKIYVALPYVIRSDNRTIVYEVFQILKQHPFLFDGFLIRNVESLPLCKKEFPACELVADSGIYHFNKEAVAFFRQYCDSFYLPYELNRKESKAISEFARQCDYKCGLIVYSHIPMMISANCIRKTGMQCLHDGKSHYDDVIHLRDRYGVCFPVVTNCKHCYNIIYNAVPYSLQQKPEEISRMAPSMIRYDFLNESAAEMTAILNQEVVPFTNYTTGHLKRGVE